MSLAFTKLKVYLRAVVVAVVVVAVGLVLFKNRHNAVSVWFFGLTDPSKPTNVVWLLLSTASCTLIVSRVASFGWGLLKEFRKLRRQKAERKTELMQAKRAADLDARERRLDEQLKRVSNDPREEDDQNEDL